MKNYLITFNNHSSIVVEAPNSSSAMRLCTDKISTYEEISGSRKTVLVKWPF